MSMPPSAFASADSSAPTLYAYLWLWRNRAADFIALAPDNTNVFYVDMAFVAVCASLTLLSIGIVLTSLYRMTLRLVAVVGGCLMAVVSLLCLQFMLSNMSPLPPYLHELWVKLNATR